MATLALKMTDAGLAAVQGASGSDPVTLSHLGLTATPFDYAPTLTALPGEFKRLEIESGIAASANITHLTAYDTSAETWDITGFGLFMDDGVLFAVYTGGEVVMSKAGLAFALVALDVAFSGDMAGNIAYGNATFIYPPATEEMRGVARLARQERVNAADDGEDDAVTIVTPRTLRARLSMLLQTVNQALASLSQAITDGLATLSARKVSGGGLVSGGGDLTQDRTLTVSEASGQQMLDGDSAGTVVTPRRIGPVELKLEANGFARFFGLQIAWGRWTSPAAAGAALPVAFARPFSGEPFSLVTMPVNNLSEPAFTWSSDGITGNTFPARCSVPNIGCRYIAVGAPS